MSPEEKPKSDVSQKKERMTAPSALTPAGLAKRILNDSYEEYLNLGGTHLTAVGFWDRFFTKRQAMKTILRREGIEISE